MTRIATAGHVLVPAILALEQDGFLVTRQVTGGSELWAARRDETEFVGADPIQLLGLAHLHTLRGDSWQATDGEIDDVLRRYRLSAPT